MCAVPCKYYYWSCRRHGIVNTFHTGDAAINWLILARCARCTKPAVDSLNPGKHWHTVIAVDPVDVEEFAGQSVQAELPTDNLKVLAGQCWQELMFWLMRTLYLPGTHTQALGTIAPRPTVIVFAGHCTHDDDCLLLFFQKQNLA